MLGTLINEITFDSFKRKITEELKITSCKALFIISDTFRTINSTFVSL